jgi:molybdenum cofactor guanylyltransferase
MKVTGCILAGGRSSRFGADKALVIWRGKTLLTHCVERLRPQVDKTVINTNSSAPQYRAQGLILVPDRTDSFDGPLAGVLAGLEWARENGASHLATVAVDTPLFPESLVAALSKKAEKKIVAAESAAGFHPTFALWPVSAAPALASWLACGQSRKMTDFLNSQAFETAMFASTGPLDPFFNINTPEDLAALSRS